MRILFILTLIILAIHTGNAQKRKIVKEVKAVESKLNYHSGLVVYDIKNKKELINYQGDRYFTPASNTKIFTLYTSLKILGDSIPGIYYQERPDSLILWGTGDPSLLYENVPQSNVWTFLKKDSDKKIYLSDNHFRDKHFGPGWSWDDYSYSYQVEKAALPIFGNYFHVTKESGAKSIDVEIDYFKRFFWFHDSTASYSPVQRHFGSNLTDYYPKKEGDSFDEIIPFRYSNFLAAELLSDTLSKKIYPANISLPPNKKLIYSVKSDSLYRVLMQSSDNFIAEQLLLMCAGSIADTLMSSIAIEYSKKNFLSDLPDEPLWVDGSGLSRYNQFIPRSIVRLWEKLYLEFGTERLFPILAVGGKSGTIKGWYNNDTPYIYGKTGTLRNHHSLSGYLITEKGNTLIFSFMHGHYPGSSSTVKKEMERILQMIRQKY